MLVASFLLSLFLELLLCWFLNEWDYLLNRLPASVVSLLSFTLKTALLKLFPNTFFCCCQVFLQEVTLESYLYRIKYNLQAAFIALNGYSEPFEPHLLTLLSTTSQLLPIVLSPIAMHLMFVFLNIASCLLCWPAWNCGGRMGDQRGATLIAAHNRSGIVLGTWILYPHHLI